MTATKSLLTGAPKTKTPRQARRARAYTIKQGKDGRWTVLDQDFRCHGAFTEKAQAEAKKAELDAVPN